MEKSHKRQCSAMKLSDESKDTHDSEHGNLPPTQIMLKRWESTNMPLPQIDRDDVHNDNPLLNGARQCFFDKVRQHAPEFSQISYLRMRAMEEAFSITDYLDPKCNGEY